MFKNHLRVAWRNLRKNGQFTILNLMGLSIGLACTLLIGLWVSDEWLVDKFFQKDNQLFQVLQNPPTGDGSLFTTEHTPGILAESLKKDMPEVEEAATVVFTNPMDDTRGILSAGGARIKASEIYATGNFFEVFSYPFLLGNKDQILSDKHAVLLSKALALKLFHTTENVIGKRVEWDRPGEFSGNTSGSYWVSGIFEGPPANASAQFDAVFSYARYYEMNTQYLNNWGSSNPSTFLILKKGTDLKTFNNKLRGFMREKWRAANGEKDVKWIGTLFAQRYSDRYLYNRYEEGAAVGGRIEYVRLFSIIAVFLLLIACINFMNLSTAQASGRIKEVGIRKVIGARRGTLVLQYLGESLLLSVLSLLLAIGLVWLCLPAFKAITGKALHLSVTPGLFLSVAGITLITGLLAGSYPAFYLSGFKPVRVLKGKFTSSASETWIRKGLVVFQFALSAILIVSVGVVYRQMNLIQTRNLGYSRDQVIHFPNEGNLQYGLASFLTELKKIPGVVNASDMNGDLMGTHSGTGGVRWEGKDPNVGVEFSGLYVDDNFVETMGLQMVEGRPLSGKYGTDSLGVIFSETAIATMKLKNPVGRIVNFWGTPRVIVGVVKDFHFESLYKKIQPFYMMYSPNSSTILVKLQAGTEKATLARIGEYYKQFNLGLPFEYKFLDADYQALYASEQRVSTLSRWFAGIAILISCLGLFGLAAFTAQKRKKEIGIRKVVGASVSQIAVLLSTDFLKLVLLAVLIALPVAWWTMHTWLLGFAYRVNFGWDLLLVAVVSVVLITLAAISFQTIRAAMANPTESLRAE
ncbi:MAG TPA: ABC transporter permease [Puia sp.]|nr:ABC transporter permease [Puia sp.]